MSTLLEESYSRAALMMKAISQPNTSVQQKTGAAKQAAICNHLTVAACPQTLKNAIVAIAANQATTKEIRMGSLAKVDERKLLAGELSVSSSIKLPSARARTIWKLAKGGKPKADIAAQFSIEIKSVNRAIRQVDRWLAAAVAVDLVGFKANAHAKLGVIHDQAMLGWHKSAGKVVKRVKKYGQDPLDPLSRERVILEETETEEYRAGDPKFLTVAMKALSEQREMLPGANAPKATALTNQSGTGDAQLNIDMRGLIASITPEQAQVLLGQAELVHRQIEAQQSSRHQSEPQ